ncbi:MAG TPA: hypothetical protein VFQ90_07140 [Stellaceae bacterium]|jgi:hypothetical protein|nr:hypothetical protein [Stellaceae bacterium]
MDYDPDDYILTGRRVIGAWVACFTFLGVVFVAPAALHRAHNAVAQARAAVVAYAPAAVKERALCVLHMRRAPPGPGRPAQPS